MTLVARCPPYVHSLSVFILFLSYEKLRNCLHSLYVRSDDMYTRYMSYDERQNVFNRVFFSMTLSGDP